jgi:glycosyltransferase involved in cell wall biosynthesis
VNIAINNREGNDEVIAATTSMTSVAFIVSGDHNSPMGFRARAMASKLSHAYNIEIAYRSRRKLISIPVLLAALVRARPDASYLFDISYTGLLASGCYKLLFRNSLIVETGDALAELVRSTGSRGKFGIWLTRLLERTAFHLADRIVVRGNFHKEWLSKQGIAADVIQDGVDTESFTASEPGELRQQHGVEEVTTIGLIGSSIWSEKLQMCYGWELVETLRLLKDRPVKGIMIGSGSGIPQLKARCREYGIGDKIIFLGHVAFERLPAYLGLIDICLSTQTNDIVGQVRTTGKLPLYLAAGRYVLASKVGEAAIVLQDEMLVDYEGVKDHGYPQKLAARVEVLLASPEMLEHSAHNVALAQKYFDYRILAERMKEVIGTTIKNRRAH